MGLFSSLQFDSFQDLFVAHLKELHDAEIRLVEALPQLAEAAESPDLASAFQQHLTETRSHVERLKQAFLILSLAPQRTTSQAMKGLITEGEEIAAAKGDAHVRDAALIAAAQQIEHYEMASYGSLRTFAQHMGNADLAELMQATLDEESNVDRILTQIAEHAVNIKAEQAH